jgi:CHASE3 domain sensor protein
MKNSSRPNRRAQLAFGSAILALLLVSAVLYRGIVVSDASERRVRHSHQVLQTLQNLRFAIQRLQLKSRGFVLTGEESFLLAYQSSGMRTKQDQIALRELTADNPEQWRHFPLLESFGNQEIERAEMVMDLRWKQGMKAAVRAMQSRLTQQTVGDFQTAIGQVQDEEAEVDAVKSYQLQANCYLTKPVQKEAFESLVKSIWLIKVKLPRQKLSG